MRAADIPICQRVDSSTAGTHLLATDRATSLLAASHGSSISPVAYCAYGNKPTASLPAAPGYNGEHLEAVGFYLLGRGERGYNPRLRRFISPDRASIFLAGNLNAYAYTAGDPINYNDPSGNLPNPLTLYKSWKAGKAGDALAKTSNALKDLIGDTDRLNFNVQDAPRKELQRKMDIEALDAQIQDISQQIIQNIKSRETMDGTIIFKKTRSGLKAIYLDERYAQKVAAKNILQQTLDDLHNQRFKLDEEGSYVNLAQQRLAHNRLAIKATRTRLAYLKAKYPAVVAKAMRSMT